MKTNAGRRALIFAFATLLGLGAAASSESAASPKDRSCRNDRVASSANTGGPVVVDLDDAAWEADRELLGDGSTERADVEASTDCAMGTCSPHVRAPREPAVNAYSR